MPRGEAVSSSGTRLYIGTNPSTGTELYDILEFPKFRNPPEKKETTTLTDTIKTYRPGLPDPGDMEFKALFTGMTVSGFNGTTWAALKAIEASGEPEDFCVVFADGSGYTWPAYVYVGTEGKGPDDNMEFTFTMYPTDDLVQLSESTPPTLTFVCVDGTGAGATKSASVSPALTGGNSYMYKINAQLPYLGEDLTGLGWAAYTLGNDIPVVHNNRVVLAEVSTGDVVVKAGHALSVVV